MIVPWTIWICRFIEEFSASLTVLIDCLIYLDFMGFCQLPLVPGKEVTDRKEVDEEEMNFEDFYWWSLSTVAEYFWSMKLPECL